MRLRAGQPLVRQPPCRRYPPCLAVLDLLANPNFGDELAKHPAFKFVEEQMVREAVGAWVAGAITKRQPPNPARADERVAALLPQPAGAAARLAAAGCRRAASTVQDDRLAPDPAAAGYLLNCMYMSRCE